MTKTGFEKQQNRIKFLLTFFKEPHTSFALIKVNGFILNRYITPEGGAYVAVYSEDSYRRSLAPHGHQLQKPNLFSVENVGE